MLINVGDGIEAKVIKIDNDERRIALSMRSGQASKFNAAPATDATSVVLVISLTLLLKDLMSQTIKSNS